MDLASEIKKSHDEAMTLADKAYACKNSGSVVEAIDK